jgi:large repetitive protein
MKKIFSLFAIAAIAIVTPLFAQAATLSTPLTVGTSYPNLGGSSTVSGSCGVPGANSTVSFSLMRNGTTTTLPVSNNVTTNAAGNFSGNVTFPTTYDAGQATLVATCTATGDIINSSALIFPAQASTTFGLNSSNPTVGGTYNLTGACGGSNGTGSAQINIVNNGNATSVGTISLSPTGTFNSPVVIPANYPTGSSTLMATCSNGTTFSSPITVNPAAVSSFSSNSNIMLGSNSAVSGSCGTLSGNANGNVSFSLLRNGAMTPLNAVNTSTNASGVFNSVISYPTNYTIGPATLVVTCPGGGTYTNQLSISGSGLTAPADLGITPGTAAPISTISDPTALGGIAGVETNAVPVGGVNAGTPAQITGSPSLLALLSAVLLIGVALIASHRLLLSK